MNATTRNELTFKKLKKELKTAGFGTIATATVLVIFSCAIYPLLNRFSWNDMDKDRFDSLVFGLKVISCGLLPVIAFIFYMTGFYILKFFTPVRNFVYRGN